MTASRQFPLTESEALQLCQDYRAIQQDLVVLLAEEGRSLQSGGMATDQAPSVHQKTHLIDRYEAKSRLMVRHLKDIQSLVPQEIEKIRKEQASFYKSLDDYQLILASVHETALTLIRNVAETLSKTRRPNLYSPYGKGKAQPETHSALMINESF